MPQTSKKQKTSLPATMSDAIEIIAVRRATRFSPNSVDRDDAILKAVCDKLQDTMGSQNPITLVDEDVFATIPKAAEIYVTMARSTAALKALQQKTEQGALCVNSVKGVRNCQRSLLQKIMQAHHIPMPEATGEDGTWLKRGDAAAQDKGDVVFCPDRESLAKAMADFRSRGITDYVTSAHVKGDLVKFYGVGNRLFRLFYPTDEGYSKFGNEALNGSSHHYHFDEHALREDAFRLSQLTGVTAYGGDAIIDQRGQHYIIDFNDWPSFSRCRQEAAQAIADEVIAQYNERQRPHANQNQDQ